jgi:hypothetical protein
MSTFVEKSFLVTYYASIHMAGSVEKAKDVIQQWALKGACVQVTECDYVFTGGREPGFVARLINYPRFPKTPTEISRDARELADLLATELGQISYSIERSNVTSYFEREGYSKQPGVNKGA